LIDDRMRELLRYRMRQADDSLREASILRNADAQRGAVSRAYYAMFYALLALLATKQLGTSRHSGAISLFDREFVKTGVFAPDLSKSLHLAFDRRQIHDYGEMIDLDASTSDEAIADATRFVAAIRQYLSDHGML
jgi:uncharacterized protein (UPF0332 family)